MPSLKANGNMRCQCAGCDLYFNSEGAFNKHRTGEHGNFTRRCRTEAEMLEIGMAKNSGGYWVSELVPEGYWAKKSELDTLI